MFSCGFLIVSGQKLLDCIESNEKFTNPAFGLEFSLMVDLDEIKAEIELIEQYRKQELAELSFIEPSEHLG